MEKGRLVSIDRYNNYKLPRLKLTANDDAEAFIINSGRRYKEEDKGDIFKGMMSC